MPLTISQTTRTSYPRLPYERIKNDILGESYDLSLAFIGTKRAQELNRSTRGKEYTPNVLAFPLDKDHGEIYITPEAAKHEAASFSHAPRTHIAFLFIHALLHLRGFRHGTEMESNEQHYMEKYRFTS